MQVAMSIIYSTFMVKCASKKQWGGGGQLQYRNALMCVLDFDI